MASPKLEIRALIRALEISWSVRPGCLPVGGGDREEWGWASRVCCQADGTVWGQVHFHICYWTPALCPLLFSVPQHPKEED